MKTKHISEIASLLQMELESTTAAQRFVRGGRMDLYAIVRRVLELKEMLDAPEDSAETADADGNTGKAVQERNYGHEDNDGDREDN